MANSPRAGLTFLGFKCDAAVRRMIDSKRGDEGLSEWMRSAVMEKLERDSDTEPSVIKKAYRRVPTAAQDTSQGAPVPLVRVPESKRAKHAQQRAALEHKLNDAPSIEPVPEQKGRVDYGKVANAIKKRHRIEQNENK